MERERLNEGSWFNNLHNIQLSSVAIILELSSPLLLPVIIDFIFTFSLPRSVTSRKPQNSQFQLSVSILVLSIFGWSLLGDLSTPPAPITEVKSWLVEIVAAVALLLRDGLCASFGRDFFAAVDQAFR